jgi:hypothetical protein
MDNSTLVTFDVMHYYEPMYVERVPNRNSPAAVLLRESVRHASKFSNVPSPISPIGRSLKSIPSAASSRARPWCLRQTSS